MDSKYLIPAGVVVLVLAILWSMASRPRAMPHQRAAMPLHTLIVVTFGLLALASIAGGVVAIVRSAKSNTEFSLLGAKLSTGDVGVALVGIGLIIAYFTLPWLISFSLGVQALLLLELPQQDAHDDEPE
jgi:hypothetical protein